MLCSRARVKATSERLASKHVEPTRVRQAVVAMYGRLERTKRFGVAVHDARAIDNKCCRPRRDLVRGPRGKRNVGSVVLDSSDKPVQVQRSRSQPRRDPRNAFAKRRPRAIHGDEQGSETARPARHVGRLCHGGNAQRPAVVIVERRGWRSKAQCRDQGCKAVYSAGGGEQRSGRSQCPHSDTLETARLPNVISALVRPSVGRRRVSHDVNSPQYDVDFRDARDFVRSGWHSRRYDRAAVELCAARIRRQTGRRPHDRRMDCRNRYAARHAAKAVRDRRA